MDIRGGDAAAAANRTILKKYGIEMMNDAVSVARSPQDRQGPYRRLFDVVRHRPVARGPSWQARPHLVVLRRRHGVFLAATRRLPTSRKPDGIPRNQLLIALADALDKESIGRSPFS